MDQQIFNSVVHVHGVHVSHSAKCLAYGSVSSSLSLFVFEHKDAFDSCIFLIEGKQTIWGYNSGIYLLKYCSPHPLSS